MGYSKNSRPNIFAKRVAPVQISYLGFQQWDYWINFMDYIIADEILIPKSRSKGLFLKK